MFLVPPHIENADEEETTKVPEGHPVTWSCLAAGEHHTGSGGGVSRWEMGLGDLSFPLGCGANGWRRSMI